MRGGVGTFFMVFFKMSDHFKLISHLDPSPKMVEFLLSSSRPCVSIIGLFQKKLRQKWLKHVFKKSLKFLGLWLYPCKFWRKKSLTSGNFTKLCYDLSEFQDQKTKSMEIPHDFFGLDENSTLFHLIPGIPICSSIPWKFHGLIFWIFSGIAHNICK